MKTLIRVIIPDTHGSVVDTVAARAFFDDLKMLDPGEIVMLGDHVDASSVFNVHLPGHPKDLAYSYEEDCAAGNAFLDAVQRYAPHALIHYIEGNHEAHIARWAARTFTHPLDAEAAARRNGPEMMLKIRERGIRYYSSDRFHMGLPVPGTIRLGKCVFTHGITSCKHSATAHLTRFGCSVVFGHTHRTQSEVIRLVASGTIGAWSVGCLCTLHPLWRHTQPTDWTHGYGVQFVAADGKFTHVSVPIDKGVSMLRPLIKEIQG